MEYEKTSLYDSRFGRNVFAATLIKRFLQLDRPSVLNIGGGSDNDLAEILPQADVTSVDISPSADICFNLDSDDSIPCNRKRYDCVVALDVLEHLESFHRRLDEALHLTERYCLISLPISPSEAARISIFPSKYKRKKLTEGVFSKFYGLPLERPVDRHRWFIYGDDVIRLGKSIERKGFSVTIMLDPISSSKIIQSLLFFVPQHIRLNFLARWAWIVAKRNEAAID